MTIERALGLAASLLVAGGLVAGCSSATRRTGLNGRLIRPAQSGSSTAPAPYDTAVRSDALEAVIGKIRELSARARPVSKTISGPTIESFDRELAAALLALDVFPGAESHRRVAHEYARVGIFDAAHRHYRAALALNPYDGAAFDGLARLWRDARLPWLGLGDARRAVYYAPRSPEARNTLGTVLQAIGQNAEARRAYESALELAPFAPYALNNLGYLAFVEGNTPSAIRYFRAAIAADAAMVAPRHNLALAYAAARRMDLAREALLEAGPPAQAEYNLGIIGLARGRPSEAFAAFEQSCRTNPAQPHACERAAALKTRGTTLEGGTP